MTFPASDVNTTNVDGTTDSPAAARSDFLDLFTKFNLLRNHFSTLAQTLVGRATAALMRSDLGASTVGDAVFTATDAAAARAALGAQSSLGYTAADDAAVVKLTGSQTIAGVITFSSQPALPHDVVLSSAITASGTEVNVTTGIPSWINELSINFVGLSTNGTSNYLVQLRSGSFVTSGYTSSNSSGSGGVTSNTITNGHFLAGNVASGANFRGSLTLKRHPGNVWVGTSVLSSQSSSGFYMATSDVTLPGDLDGFKLTTANGADAFDAGSFSFTGRK